MRIGIRLLVFISTFGLITQAQNASFGGFLSGGGSTGSDRAADVVTDATGNIFTANTFLLQATFNGNTFSGAAKGSGASYDNNLLITKLSPAKTTLWSIYSNVGAVSPVALATTANGDLIVTGNIRAIVNTTAQTTTANIIDALGTVTTFTGLGSATANVQSFVAKFNSSGVIQWVKEFNSDASKLSSVLTDALACDADGNIYLTGNFVSSVILPSASPVTLTSTNSGGTSPKAAFITKLDGSTGQVLWNKASSGGIYSEILSAITYGDDGYIYAAGIYRNATSTISVTIGDKNFTPSSGYDLTLLKFDSNGNLSYIQNRSNLSDTRVKDITEKNGKVFVSGSFRGDNLGIQFSSAALTSTTPFLNGFIVCFSTLNGTDCWQKSIFSPGIVESYGVTIPSDGRLYAFGGFANKGTSTTAGSVDFGNSKTIADTNPTNSSADLFLASYNVSDGTTLELHTVGTSAGFETASSMVSSGVNLYLLGTTNSSVVFENSTTYSSLGAYDFLLVNYTVTNPFSEILTPMTTKFPFAMLTISITPLW